MAAALKPSALAPLATGLKCEQKMRPFSLFAFLKVFLYLTPLYAQPASLEIRGAPLPIRVLAQSPADTRTDLQVICLFRSSPVNTLHGSLTEMNEKLNGLLDRIRRPELFRGELGETLLMKGPSGSLHAKKLLIIGLGNSQDFSPERMELVGEILYIESSRLGIAHPYFAPTILDGGVAKFTTGEVAEQVIAGFLRAAEVEKTLRQGNASGPVVITGLTYLAGAENVESTLKGIEKAIGATVK
jgi:Cytosol aminopeptidase family, N-terminal domain